MLAPWKKSYDQPRQHIKKQRYYFADKGSSSQSYVFFSTYVWMWELDYKESWAPKNDAFELWCWRRLLEVPWTARRSNQSILKEISPEYSLEELRLKLKLQYFGHLMQRSDSLAKTLMLGKVEGGRRRGQQMMKGLDGHHPLDGHEFEQTPGVGDGQGSLACCSPWACKESDRTERLNWTDQYPNPTDETSITFIKNLTKTVGEWKMTDQSITNIDVEILNKISGKWI